MTVEQIAGITDLIGAAVNVWLWLRRWRNPRMLPCLFIAWVLCLGACLCLLGPWMMSAHRLIAR